jgi:hypothetical protein
MNFFRKVILFSCCSIFLTTAVVSQNSSDTIFVINKIVLTGNKITRPQVVMRELLFKENDTVSENTMTETFEQSRKNLLNTSLFNFVTITTDTLPNKRVDVTIDMTERWYVWPMPFFELKDRNFNVWWKDKDFSKVDYGLYLTWENFRGRKESLKMLIRLGYNETFGMAYKVPYINRAKTLGFGITGGFGGNHEVPYITEDSKQLFYKDKEKYVQRNIYGTFGFTLRKGYYVLHTFQLNYNNNKFSDTLFSLNSEFAPGKYLQFFTFYYQFKCDHRDIKNYPLTGYYFDVELSKSGFGILNDETVHYDFIHTSGRKFWKLSDRWYYACGINAKAVAQSYQPYFIQRSLGYGNDIVRSYEYYVIDGQSFGLFKSNIKFELLPTKVKTFKFIPAKKFNKLFFAFYLNGIFDVGYVYDSGKFPNSSMKNQVLFGTGLGLDFVTYYDKVLRIEWTVNHKGENGIFLNFVAPI